MILLVNGATKTISRHTSSRQLGHLITPRSQNRLDVLLASGLPFAADNGCFKGFEERAFVAMLDRIRAIGRRMLYPLWVAVPDKVADAAETWAMWHKYHHLVKDRGLPMAFVGQDGCQAMPIPWDDMACLFIGGTDDWKLGPDAAQLVVEAKERKKWVHIGRVNTRRRELLFDPLGADSIDGGKYSKWPDTYIPQTISRLEYKQTGLVEILTSHAVYAGRKNKLAAPPRPRPTPAQDHGEFQLTMILLPPEA